VLDVNRWFSTLLGGRNIPRRPVDWLDIREYELLHATNGEVWHDGPGEVTRIRRFLSYYPEAVWRKRLALKCAEISQSRNNVIRCHLRQDTVAANLALHRLVVDAIQIWSLLKRKYAPFYKWLYRAFSELDDVPEGVNGNIVSLVEPTPLCQKLHVIENVLDDARNAIGLEFPSVSSDADSNKECGEMRHDFNRIADVVDRSITDPEVRERDVWDQVAY